MERDANVGDCPWTACDKLYFAQNNQPLSAHPRVILMLASLPPSSSVRLGKQKSGKLY